MPPIFWQPSVEQVARSNMTAFMRAAEEKWHVSLPDYSAMYQWSIIRPEQFITPQVCGLSVPVMYQRGGRLSQVWRTYLRWSDGRRDCIELDDHLELPNGSRLWGR